MRVAELQPSSPLQTEVLPPVPAGPAPDLDADFVGGDNVKYYLDQAGAIDRLSREEVTDLAKRIEAGLYADHKLQEAARNETPIGAAFAADLHKIAAEGKQAKDDLISANLLLVVSIAKRYAGKGVPFLDLIQAGNLGLIRAVEKFDYRQGYTISTYATRWIKKNVKEALVEELAPFKVPKEHRDEVERMQRTRRDLEKTGAATLEDIAKAMKISMPRLLELLEYEMTPTSLNKAAGDGGDMELGEVLSDKTVIGPEQAVVGPDVVPPPDPKKILADSLLGQLDPRTATVVRLRICEGWRAEDVARKLKLSSARVRHLEVAGLIELRTLAAAQAVGATLVKE